MNKTSIQWTDFSVNMLKYRDADGRDVWACAKTSPGCVNCYSEAIAERFKRGGPFTLDQIGKVTPYFDEAEAAKVLRSKKLAGKRVFVSDMTDLFGEWVPDEIIDRHFAVFALRPEVTFQVLTKRAERMQKYMTTYKPGSVCDASILKFGKYLHTTEYKEHSEGIYTLMKGPPWPLPNVHLGVSCEDQQRADERISHLLQTPAAVRFLSFEPLLGAIDVFKGTPPGVPAWWQGDLNPISRVQWVIVGGESGSSARPCEIGWIRSIVQQCKGAGVPCFVKQIGSSPLFDEADIWSGATDVRRLDRKGGDMQEWPEDLRVREFPRKDGER